MGATFSTPPNPLAKRVGSKGVSRASAIEQAEANIVSMRDDGLAYVDQNLDVLNATFASPPADPSKAVENLYDASNAIAGTAALFGNAPLGAAAYSLCQLLSYADPSTGWNSAAVKAHLDGMQMLRRFGGGGHDEAAKVILDNLARLLAHLSPKADAAAR
jgi:hypothetical protein